MVPLVTSAERLLKFGFRFVGESVPWKKNNEEQFLYGPAFDYYNIYRKKLVSALVKYLNLLKL